MTAERTMLCPVVVGRAAELRTLEAAIDDAIDGRGGVIVLAGGAGVGKTRLARVASERAAQRGMAGLAGRCVPGDSPVPYRPLTEAFVTAFRGPSPPRDPQLAGFGVYLGRLVPHWRDTGAGGTDESPVLLAEAVVRLAHLASGSDATLLLLEDLHWADVETLAVVDYLADTLRDQPVVCLCTTRPEGRAGESLTRLRRNEGVTLVDVVALPPDSVRDVIAACLGSDAVPPDVLAWVLAHSDGVPFLVEELLAGLVATGALTVTDGHWSTTGPLSPSIPVDVEQSIRHRLDALDPTARRIIQAAALLGRRFDWELLPGVAEVDGRTAVEALRAAVDAQIIAVEGDGFLFRHALSREAVLGELLPPERRDLASRAWPAIERANPGLPGAMCELAADLAEAAGEHGAAAERLVESARRALDGGAYATGEATAERARRLAPSDDPVALDATRVLVQILAAAGKPSAALALGQPVVERLREQGSPDLADLLLVMARAALAAGDADEAARLTDAAREGLDGHDASLAARVDAIAAYVALDQGLVLDAGELAQRALQTATSTEQPAVACEALEVLGRVADVTAPGTSTMWFQRAADLAATHGLAGWELRARHELALQRWGDGDIRPIREVRDLAARTGALVTQAVMDLSLADLALAGFEREVCLEAATACVGASRRYGLATESVAHLWLAGAHALAGDDEAMEASLADALARDPDDPRILGDLHGRVMVTRAFVADDLDSLQPQLDSMMDYVDRAPPGVSIFPGRGLWATLHATHDDDDGAAALASCREWAAAVGMLTTDVAVLGVEAVVRGRRGDHEGAAGLVEQVRITRDAISIGKGIRHSQQVLVSMAAMRDGWGAPAAWLRESEAFFAGGGYERAARRCRTLIGDTGAPVPRRRADATPVPPSLRALGITSRELDVLALVVDGRSTRDIADALYLSPKTVERHLANLFDRTGVRNRAALAELAREHGLGARLERPDP